MSSCLVSDGKETPGDPTLAARPRRKGLTVHTVGFIVDTARAALQAIAQATGGTYFDARFGPELPEHA